MARPSRGFWLAGLLGGAGTSLFLWAFDLWSLGSLGYAGAQAGATEAAVRHYAASAILGLEVKLALTHLVLGALLGLLVAAALGPSGRGRRAPAGILRVGLLVLTLHLLALAGMIARYPQLYAGGDRSRAVAALQYVLTHRLGPWPFDALLLVLLTLCLGRTALRLLRDVPRARRVGAAWRGAALLGVIALLGLAEGRASSPPPAPPNLLVIGVDSLRTDRIESSEVMPFTSSLIQEGALFRYAFTPIARTFPSWVSTLTGREPRHHGVRSMFPRNEERRDTGPTFVSELRDAGYRTFVVGNFAGDIFPRFDGGFETVDAPGFTVDSLARSSLLAAHRTTLPLLRLRPLRAWLGEWRNLPNLADPEWLAQRTLEQVGRRDARPFAGLVFFDTAHFPFAPPHPYFKWKAGSYRGRYLYDVPPTEVGGQRAGADVDQIRNRYDGAVRAMDAAIQRLMDQLRGRGLLENTVLVVMADHGEDLLEREGIFGHGDTLGIEHSQYVPILIMGPGVPRGLRSNRQVRLYDLAPTLLSLLRPGTGTTSYGDGLSLLADGPRPICVETGIWFWPDLPAGLRGRRMTYAPIDQLVEVSPENREIVLRRDRQAQVEAYKERGLVWGRRLWHERATPEGRLAETVIVPGVDDEPTAPADLKAAFEERCVQGDASLRRAYGNLVFTPPR